jgi:hypothetical protein
VYRNKTYTQCTLEGHHKPWCALSVDPSGVAGDHWGECRPDCAGYDVQLDRCLATDGWPCVFPFEYGGSVYDACTDADHDDGRRWCSILNFPNGTMQQWQVCQDSKQCSGRT